MPNPRLLIVPMLAMMAACSSSSPEPRRADPAVQSSPRPAEETPASQQRLVSSMAEQCRDRVARHQGAVVTSETSAVRMREDWVQVDGTMKWRGEAGTQRNAWTCDMFRDEEGTWYPRYMSFGPVT